MTTQTALQAVHAYLSKNPKSTVEAVISALTGNWTAITIRNVIVKLNAVGALRTEQVQATGQVGRPAFLYSVRKTVSRKTAIASVNAAATAADRQRKRRKILAANAAKARAALAQQRAAKLATTQAVNTIIANRATKSAARSAKLVTKSANPWGGASLAPKRDTGLSIANQLALQLATRIQAGKISVGTQIPGENKLGELNNVAHATAARAVKALAAKGLAVKVDGRYQVAKTKATRKAA